MRRAAAAGLIGLGAFLLALAVLLPTVVVPRVEKAPLDQYSTSIATGTGEYLDPTTLEFDEGAVTVTRITRGDVDAGSDDIAVYEQSQTTEVETIDEPLVVIREKIVLDRESGVGVGGQGDRPNHEGAYTVKLPFDTKEGEYLLHDAVAGKAYPIEYVGEAEIDGTTVLEFESGPTDPEVIRQLGVPGRLVGAPEASSVFVEETYQNLGRTVLVEPRTGAIVGGSSHPRRAFRPVDIGSDAGTETAIFDAEVTIGDEIAAQLLADAKDSADTLNLLGRTLPILFAVAGLAALLLGLLLSRRNRRPYEEEVVYEEQYVVDETQDTTQLPRTEY